MIWGEREKPAADPDPAGGSGWGRTLKWTLFGLALLYALIASFHVQILTELGRYLVVEHAPSRSDLIVCLSGRNIERGLSAAECYHKGLAPRIFIAPEEPPDGLALLSSKSIEYPQTVDLLTGLLQNLGVPRSALLIGSRPAPSTADEAKIVEELMEREGHRSIILVTSPIHSRRSYLTFTKVLSGKDIRIQVVPSPYSKFRPEDWWKHRKYQREVLLEYQKLAYYHLKELR
jgi:uncharacterized SAM-binding protein YcdF (DUF218 family)